MSNSPSTSKTAPKVKNNAPRTLPGKIKKAIGELSDTVGETIDEVKQKVKDWVKGAQIRPAKDIYAELMKNTQHVVVDSPGAVELLKFFLGKESVYVAAVPELSHRAFVQAVLMSAINANQGVGFAKALLESAYKPNATVQGIIRKLAKQAFQQYFNQVEIAKLKVEDLKFYSMVFDTVVGTNRADLEMIAGNGD